MSDVRGLGPKQPPVGELPTGGLSRPMGRVAGPIGRADGDAAEGYSPPTQSRYHAHDGSTIVRPKLSEHSQVVLTIVTSHGAWCATEFGTLPST